MFFRHLPNPHLFVSVANDAQADDAKLYADQFLNVKVEVVDQPAIPEPWGQVTIGHPSFHGAYAIQGQHSGGVQAILRQWWHLKRVYDFAKANGLDGYFGLVVRLRPDLWFHEFKPPVLPKGKMALRFDSDDGLGRVVRKCAPTVFTPFWGNYGGCNDRLAIMTPGAAEHYFGVFDHYERHIASGCPLHPETMLAHHLETNGVTVSRNMRATFSTVRLPADENGQQIMRVVQPEVNWLDIATLLSC